jgi:hypothetical protein
MMRYGDSSARLGELEPLWNASQEHSSIRPSLGAALLDTVYFGRRPGR